MSDTPTVIVHFDQAGEIVYHVVGDVRLFIVDERAPHDRVYEWNFRDTAEDVAAILGDGQIGHSGDERHAAAANRIRSAQDRRSHLSVVPNSATEREHGLRSDGEVCSSTWVKGGPCDCAAPDKGDGHD